MGSSDGVGDGVVVFVVGCLLCSLLVVVVALVCVNCFSLVVGLVADCGCRVDGQTEHHDVFRVPACLSSAKRSSLSWPVHLHPSLSPGSRCFSICWFLMNQESRSLKLLLLLLLSVSYQSIQLWSFHHRPACLLRPILSAVVPLRLPPSAADEGVSAMSKLSTIPDFAIPVSGESIPTAALLLSVAASAFRTWTTIHTQPHQTSATVGAGFVRFCSMQQQSDRRQRTLLFITVFFNSLILRSDPHTSSYSSMSSVLSSMRVGGRRSAIVRVVDLRLMSLLLCWLLCIAFQWVGTEHRYTLVLFEIKSPSVQLSLQVLVIDDGGVTSALVVNPITTCGHQQESFSFALLKPRGVSCLLGSREDTVITEQGQRRVT